MAAPINFQTPDFLSPPTIYIPLNRRSFSHNDLSTVASPMSLSRPQVSSPLAVSFDSGPSHSQQPIPRPPMPARKNSGFMQSRALRPFPTISHALQPPKSSNVKPVKLIQPPQNCKMTFVLDLTQAEFSRQD
ncbi:hypothetical protein BKA70DRAFT_1418270 [Coprinopsis sp. MPI-PUGE-AT-0042]|nr:hypothetical protein BKA70DRAFT_1418270 [Coprinopsis sp. MPI-PUGE-AT-0042]